MKRNYIFMRAFSTVSSLTMVSRLMGLFRDILFAAYLGAGIIADAFLIAFLFPNIFRRLFAEGAFTAGFVPLFNTVLKKEGQKEAIRFVEEVFSLLVCILLIFIIIVIILMPLLIIIIAPGFLSIPNQIEYTTDLARITFPYLFFISLVSLQSGVLNAFGRFASAAATPIILNLTLILSLVFAIINDFNIAVTLCWGLLVTGLLQFLWLHHFIRSLDISIKFIKPRFNERIKLLLQKILPLAFGAGLYQINLIVDKLIATLVSAGAVSWLYFADRINQLPIGVVGVGIGVALLPLLSKKIQDGENEQAIESQNRAIELGLMLSIPASIGIFILSFPIVSTIFERGLFSPLDRNAVASALAAFSSGLPAYILIKSIVPGFFSRHDTSTPFKIASLCMIVNILLNLLLMHPFGHIGIALATSLSSWLNAMLLAYILIKRKHLKLDKLFYFRLPRIIFSSLVMAGIVFISLKCFVNEFVIFYDINKPMVMDELKRTFHLTVLILIGLISYAISLILSGGININELKVFIKQKK